MRKNNLKNFIKSKTFTFPNYDYFISNYDYFRYLGFILHQQMPCGVLTPLRGRPEARQPGNCLPFEEWAEKKEKYQSKSGTPA